MERSEPTLVPQWLRTPTIPVGFSHHLSSSNTNTNTELPLPKRQSSSSSTNSPTTSTTNASIKNPSPRNQRPKDTLNLDTSQSHFSHSLPTIIAPNDTDTLRRSHSIISRRPDDRASYTDSRNPTHNLNGNAHGFVSVASGTHKVSFERDFPLLGTDERPGTPDVTRVPSPGLSRAVQGLSIGTSSLIGGEGWTSALAEVPFVGSNNFLSSPSLQSTPSGGDGMASSVPTLSEAGATNGLNMAEALVQGPVRPQNVPQQVVPTQRFEELPSVGIKKLIPMTSSMPKSSMLNPSDKLKPKTASRSNEGVAGPKNGLQALPSLQLGSLALGRGGNGRLDGLGSSKLQLLKPGREKVVSPALKDAPTQIVKVPSAVLNVQSIGSPKNPNNLKRANNERKTAGYSLNGVQVVDKRLSLAQLQSRNDFFNLVRKKSMSSTSSGDADSCALISPVVQNSGEEKEMGSGSEGPTRNGGEVICNGDARNLTENFSDQRSGSDSSRHELIHTEEELDFLRALGWEDDDGECDDEGLTEEEISAFVQKYMQWRPESKLLQGLQLKMMTESNSPASCSAGASSKLRRADSSL